MSHIKSDEVNVGLRNKTIDLFALRSGVHAEEVKDAAMLPNILMTQALALSNRDINFAKIADFPPLLVTDEEFQDCRTVHQIKMALERAQVQPFQTLLAGVAKAKETVIPPASAPVSVDIMGKPLAPELRKAIYTGVASQVYKLRLISDEAAYIDAPDDLVNL
jgi:hypothetical protein